MSSIERGRALGVSPAGTHAVDYAARHLRFGWWSLLVFAAAGLVLETLHGFKVRAYVDVTNETRRLMWTLAHAHGTGLSLVHVVFGLTVRGAPGFGDRDVRVVSAALIGASVLLPGGFFLGGIGFYSGDPGLGVLLVPFGAALLLAAVFSIARATASPASPRSLGRH
jgi:hypothetical protein